MAIKLIPKEIRKADWPEADFLTQEQQEAYKQACNQYSGKARDSLNISKNASNLFKILLLNQIGITTSTLPQLEEAVENGLDLKNFYVDGREVVLRSAGDSHSPNDYLAKNLADYFAREHFETPLVIRGLRIRQDDNSDYGLLLVPTDKTEIFEAPDLGDENNGRRFSKINPDYSIEFDEENGTKTLFTRKDGLSRFCLSRGQYLDSGSRYLADSNCNGRVVVVSAGGAQENFDECLSQLKKERDAQATKLREKFNKAIGILRGQSQ